MIDQPIYRLPTVDEVLGGETQGGVPRPAVSFEPQSTRPPRVSRWQAVKARLRLIFAGDRS